jgi:hypothetical protein
MFDIFKGQQDPDSLEIERKLDQDLLEQMLYEFKDEEFYNETKVSSSMAQVDLKNGELVNIDDFYEVLIHIEQTVDMLQFTEYKPSKTRHEDFRSVAQSFHQCSSDHIFLDKKEKPDDQSHGKH